MHKPDAADGHVSVKPGMPALLIAAAPYLMLIVLIIITRLIPPVQQVLQTVAISWEAAGFGGSMQVLYHPGSMLVLSFLAGAVIQKASWQDATATMRSVAHKMVPVLIALIAMLGLSRIMMHAGMINALAQALASSAGSMWPLWRRRPWAHLEPLLPVLPRHPIFSSPVSRWPLPSGSVCQYWR